MKRFVRKRLVLLLVSVLQRGAKHLPPLAVLRTDVLHRLRRYRVFDMPPDPFRDGEDPPEPRELIDPIVGTDWVPDWMAMVWPVLVWSIVAALVVLVVLTYLRDRPDLLRRVRPLAWVARLLRVVARLSPVPVLRRLWAVVSSFMWRRPGLRRSAARGRREGRDGDGRRPSRGAHRDELIAAYLRVVEQADSTGCTRDPSETAYEYGETLGSRLQSAHLELYRMTEAFVDARYSTHDVDRPQVERVRRDAARVLHALASVSEEEDSPPPSDSPHF
jgi:hypothetical protein